MAKLSSAELKLYIWSGDILKRPSTPTYTLNKTKLVYQTTIVFEIAELVKDYVEVEFDGNYRNIKQTKNVEWEITRTYDDDTTDSDSDESNKKYYQEGNKTRLNKERQKAKNARTSRKRNRK